MFASFWPTCSSSFDQTPLPCLHANDFSYDKTLSIKANSDLDIDAGLLLLLHVKLTLLPFYQFAGKQFSHFPACVCLYAHRICPGLYVSVLVSRPCYW